MNSIECFIAGEMKMSTFSRFFFIGIGNTTVFVLFYQALYFLFSHEGHWPTFAWMIAWIVGSIFAHYTHKRWTFKSDRDIQWTLPWTIAVYIFGLTGSTITFDILLIRMELHHQIAWFISTIIWGIIDYLGLANVAFKKEVVLSDE